MWANRISSITDTASVNIGYLSGIAGKECKMDLKFEDRTDAGDKLADRIQRSHDTVDAVVAFPGGGVVVGRQVADRFDADLHCLVVESIDAPFNPELMIGGVTSTGTYWLDEELISELSIDTRYVEDGIAVEQDNAETRQQTYGELPDMHGKTVVLVDDGIETITEVHTALQQLQDQDATTLVATPIIPQTLYNQLSDATQIDIIAISTPETFISTGHHYRSFQPLTEDDETDYLTRD